MAHPVGHLAVPCASNCSDPRVTVDPYITLTFSRLRKPLYSTRIIKDDLNPVYEETAFVLVDVNTVKLREKLSFQLWDSDRMSVVSPQPSVLRPYN